MMLQRQSAATGSARDGLNMESSRLLYDDASSMTCRAGAVNTRGDRRVDGWTASALDTKARMRKADNGSVPN